MTLAQTTFLRPKPWHSVVMLHDAVDYNDFSDTHSDAHIRAYRAGGADYAVPPPEDRIVVVLSLTIDAGGPQA